MPRSLSLTAGQVNALTTGNETILYNAQSRDILLYGGANLESKITILEIDNITGDCLTLKYNGSPTNYINFALSNAGTFNVNVNGGNKKFNLVNHDGSTNGLTLAGTLVTSSAAQLNTVNTTAGTAEANKAIILDGNLDIVGIHNIETDNLTVNGTLVTASATELNYTDITSAGTAQASKALVVDINKDIGGIRDLTTTGNVNISNHDGSTTGLELSGTLITALASDINKLSTITEGTVTASKVLIVDSNKDLASIRNLTSSGDLNLSNHDGSTTGLKLAGTLVTSSASEINKLTGVTPGTAAAGKAIVLDGSLDIVGINNIETNNLTVNGTLVTATAIELNYTDITTAGTVQASKAVIVDINKDVAGFRNLTTEGNINIYNYNGTTIGLKLAGNLVTSSAAEINTLAGVTTGTVTASKALVVDSNKDLSALNNLDIDSNLNIVNHDGSTTGLELAGTLVTSTASEINTLAGVTAGTVTASKALVVDSNRDLASVRNLTSSGSIDISNYNGTTTGLKLAGTLVTSSASEINTLSGVTAGTVTASKALVVDSNKDLSSLRNLTVAGTVSGVTTLTTDNITLGSTAITATGAEINKLAGVTPGTASTNKTLVLNSSGNISGINSISTTSLIVNGVTISSGGGGSIGPDYTTGVTPGIANANSSLVLNADKEITGIVLLSSTTLGGTLSTAAQPNITSVGSLSGLTTAGLILGATTITATGSEINKLAGVTATTSEINKLAGVTAGTVTASKALIVDANKDLSSLRNLTIDGTLDGVTTLTATTVAGTLSTAAQPNITSLGSLSGLTTVGITLGSTAITATGNEINKLAGVTASTSEINTLAGVTAGTVAVSKALIVDSNKDLASLRNLTATGTVSANALTGTLSTAAQPNITSVGSLSGVTTAGITLGATAITATGTEINILDGVTASTSEINTLAGVTAGTVAVSKALVVDSNKDLASLRNLTATGTVSANALTGTLSTAAQPNITSVGSLSGVTTAGITLGATAITATGTEINILDGVTASTLEINILDGVTATAAEINILDGVTTTSSEINTLAGVTAGTVTASKALVVDSNKDLSSLRNLGTSGTITVTQSSSANSFVSTNGTSQCSLYHFNNSSAWFGTSTGSATELVLQTNGIARLTINGSTGNITGISSLATTSLTLGATAITATGTEINTLAGVTAGTAAASKALVLDSSSNITGINNLSMGGTLTVGTVGSADNLIKFKGVTGDSSDNYAVISERLYGASDISELIIFKGNDGTGGTGPDRIRLRAPEIKFQIANEIYSSLADNTDIMVIQNDSTVGIVTLLSIGSSRSYPSSSYGANLNINDCTLSNSYTAASGTDSSHFKKVAIGTTTLSTVTNTSVTTTNASSLFIQGPPLAGTRMTLTNAYSLYVNSGTSYFTGNSSSNIRMENTTSSGNCNLWFKNDNRSFELGIRGSAAGTGPANGFYIYDNANTSFRFVIDSSGNVGIGTNAPGSHLDVRGGIASTGFMTADRIRTNAGSTAANFIGNWDDANYWGIGEHGGPNAVRIGICGSDGTWTGGYPTLVSGTYSNASDYRIKNTITPLSNVLNKIMGLRPVSYYLNQDANKINLNIGFIAHELQEQFPELVTGEKDGENHQAVNYAQLTSVLVKGIQEHQEIIKSLEEKNKTLEDRLKILEDIILNP
jgi:hypothetical protein